jgi:dihydrofolate reductase
VALCRHEQRSRCRARLRTQFLPDGTYSFEDSLDVTGEVPARVITCGGRLLELYDPDGGETAVEVSDDAVTVVRKLKQQRGKDICVLGGGELANSLLQAGLIDEVGFSIHPVLLGSGIPLFDRMEKQIDLRLLDCRRSKNGCVLVRYAVQSGPRRVSRPYRSRKH